ncbi:MAG: FGGY family carbohydrate kinase [Candidatus Promineifilaceae bacterium]|nr:FGGY family carbohydrate kinase [Candidatus Promineifilaceae bacterium]
MTGSYFLGIDQGTSGSRALILNAAGRACGYGYRSLSSLSPNPGWAEQKPDEVAETVSQAITLALADAGLQPADLVACGIACQRNTEFVWHADTGAPLGNAITWQDLRAKQLYRSLSAELDGREMRRRLGHVPAPFSSALHLAWRLQNETAVGEAARRGKLRAGFSAEWLLQALGQPRGHEMDYSLVQAMGLYDFRAGRTWAAWRRRLAIPPEVLPEARPTVHDYGTITVTGTGGETATVPVLAMIGDQQAALFGFDCRQPGDAECTHGTASFVNVCLGSDAPELAQFNLYYGWVVNETVTYCLEARTTATGSVLRWLRDEASFLSDYDELDGLVESVTDAGGVIFVPAFTGLYDPYNDVHARGAIMGLTLGNRRAHIVRAFLESLGFQVRAILDRIQAKTELSIPELFLGGGVSNSNAACQIQADLLGIPTVRIDFTETTARAAALLAGLGSGHWPDIGRLPVLVEQRQTFRPRLSRREQDSLLFRWQQAVQRTRNWADDPSNPDG